VTQDAVRAAGLAGKRIVFVLAGEIFGGAERGALDLAVHFARVEGADVRVVALDDRPGRSRGIAESEGIPWSCIRTPWVGGKSAKLASLLEVGRGLRRLHPDVLIPRTNLPNVVCGLTWRLTGANLCIWNQADVLGTMRFSRGLFRRALHASPLAVTTAYHVREWLVEEWGADPSRIHVLRSEVSLAPAAESRESWRDRLGIEESGFVACMLGHLHRGKDHTTLLRAWRIVVDRLQVEGRRALLLVAGRPAGSQDDVKALAFDLDLRDHLRFLGDVADVSGLLGAVDLGVFSSQSEAFGRGATEPMSVGLAVVATDVPGIREAVGEPGREFLARLGDAESLAAAILRLALDAGLRERVGRANAELMRERQSAEPTSRAYAQLIASALAGAGPATGLRKSPSPSSA
jgi:glycosyltransferase involved in cell wall biosynthesis